MHPPREELAAYAVGTLPEAQAQVIEGHLSNCPTCDATLDGLSSQGDTVVNKLRQGPPADPFVDESGCQNMVEIIKDIGRDASQPATGNGAGGSAQPESNLGNLREYKLLKKLGEGGMGAVYKALHTKLDKVVALKVLPADRTRNAEALARFEREMKAVGKLQHPNIVGAHDAGEANGTHFLVMELVDGEDLACLVKRRGPLPVAEACELVRQAAVGLQEAHEHGMVHRDIKPSNLMLTVERRKKTTTGVVKILDMGLALLEDPQTAPGGGELTGTGQLMGTIDYMAPEQATDTHCVDIRADIYALGATLYKLLTGEIPLDPTRHDTVVKKLIALVNESRVSIRERRPDLPAELVSLVDRMLARDPQDRPATPDDVATALEPFAVGHQIAGLLGASTGPVGTSLADGETRVATRISPDEQTQLVAPSALTANPLLAAAPNAAALPPVKSEAVTPARRAQPAAASRRTPMLIGAALAGAAALLVLAAVFFIQTPQGVIRVEIDDPDVEVVLLAKGVKIRGADKLGEIVVGPGEKTLHVKRGELEFDTDSFMLKKGEKVTVKVDFLKDTLVAALASGKVIGEATPRPQPGGLLPERSPADLAQGAVETKLRGGIERFTLSSDGKKIFAVFPLESKAVIFDSATMQPVFEYASHNVTHVFPSHNMQFLGYAHNHEGALLIPTTGRSAGTKTQVSASRVAEGSDFYWSPTGEVAFCFFLDGLRLLKADGSKPIEMGKVMGGRVSWSPDGKWFAGFVDAKFHFWKSDGTPGPVFDAPVAYQYSGMNSLRWSPDSKSVAFVDQKLTIIKPETKETRQFDHKLGDAATIVRWRPDSKALLLCNRNSNTGILTLEDLSLLTVPVAVDQSRGTENRMAFSPSGKEIVVCRGDEMHILDVADKVHPRCVLPARHMTQFAFTPDGKEIVVSYHYPGADGVLRFYDFQGKLLRALRGPLLTPEAAAELPPLLAGSAFDKLDGKAIAPEELKIAGNGEGYTTPPELVAILGESTHRLGKPVRSLQFSPDGKQLAVVSGTKMIRLDVATGRQLGEFPGSTNLEMALDRDWTKVAVGKDVGGGHKDLLVLDARTGETLCNLADHARGGVGVFGPDGKKIAAAPAGQPAKMYDADTGAPKTIIEHGGAVIGFAAGGNELAIYAGGEKWHFQVSDAMTGKKLRDLPQPHIYCVPILSPDGSRSAYPLGEAPKKIRIFETATGKQVCELEEAPERTPGAFSADNLTFANALPEAIRISDAQTGKTIRLCKLSAGYTHIAFSPDGKTLAGGDADGWIRLWNVATGELKNTTANQAGPVLAVAQRPDGTRVTIISGDGMLLDWDVAAGKALDNVATNKQILSAVVTRDGKQAALQSGADLLLWDLSDRPRQVRPFAGAFTAPHQRLKAIDSQGLTIASTGADGDVFDITKAKAIRMADSHMRQAVDFSPSGKLVVQAGENRWHQELPALSLVDASTGQRVTPLPEQENYDAAVFNPNGSLLAVAAHNKAIRLFDLRTGKVGRSLEGHLSPVRHLAWRSDGKWLASLGRDGTLFIHDLSGTKESLVKQLHFGEIGQVIRHLDFTPDGRHLLTTNANGTVFVLRLANAKAAAPQVK